MTNAIPHRTPPLGEHHAARTTAQKTAADFQKWFAETLTPTAMPSATPASILPGLNAGLTTMSSSPVTEAAGAPASVTAPVDTAASSTPTDPAEVSPAPPSVQTGPRISFFEKSVTGLSLEGTPSTYNTLQFATDAAANQMAKLIGGKVVDVELTGAFSRSAPERMIAVGGHELNAGLVADLFNKYGDAPGSEAWQVIDRDMGKSHA